MQARYKVVGPDDSDKIELMKRLRELGFDAFIERGDDDHAVYDNVTWLVGSFQQADGTRKRYVNAQEFQRRRIDESDSAAWGMTVMVLTMNAADDERERAKL